MQKGNYPEIIFSPVPICELADNLIDKIVVKLADELERRAAIRSAPPPDIPPPKPTRLYGYKAAAEHIGCTPQAVGKLRREEKIRFYTLGTRYYFYAHELDQDLRGGKHRFGELRGRRGKK
jgi:hypothetical protein